MASADDNEVEEEIRALFGNIQVLSRTPLDAKSPRTAKAEDKRMGGVGSDPAYALKRNASLGLGSSNWGAHVLRASLPR
jgi:hypothetical protein